MKRAIAFPILALLVIAITAVANYAVYVAGNEWFVQTPSMLVVLRNILAVAAVLGVGWAIIPTSARRRSSENLLLVAGVLFGLGLAMQFRLGHDAPRQLSNDEILAVGDSVAAAMPRADPQNISLATRHEVIARNSALRRSFDASRIDTRLARSLEDTYGPTAATDSILTAREPAPMDNPLLRLLPVLAAIVAIGFFARTPLVPTLAARWRLVGFYGSLALCVLIYLYISSSGGIRGANFAPQELLKLVVPVAWAGFLIYYRGAFLAETRERFTSSPLVLWLYIVALLTLPLLVFVAMRDFGQFLVFGIAQVLLLAWFTRSPLYLILFLAALLVTSVVLMGGTLFGESLLTVLAIVLGSVIVIAALERFRRRDALWTSASLVLVAYTALAFVAVQIPAVQRMLSTPRQRFLLWADLYARKGNGSWWDHARQIVESLFAFDAGGILGRGIGRGSPFLIPKASSDFIFASIAEELGLLGALMIVLGFGAIATIGLRIARDLGKESFGGLLAAGYVMLIVAQALVHITGTMNLLPMTGITLPLVSAGMSSLVVAWAMMGAIVGLSSGEDAGTKRFVIRQDLARRKSA
jgi:cell division protein FtsW (lipid II flippase)